MRTFLWSSILVSIVRFSNLWYGSLTIKNLFNMFFLKKNYGFCCWEINMCYLCFLHVIWNMIIVRVFFYLWIIYKFCYVCDDLMEEKMLCLLLAIIMLGINKIYMIWV